MIDFLIGYTAIALAVMVVLAAIYMVGGSR